MGKADKPNISKHLLDRAAFIFIRHPGIFYSRADIQNILGISKPTACRIMIELSRTMAIEEKMDGTVAKAAVFCCPSKSHINSCNKMN